MKKNTHPKPIQTLLLTVRGRELFIKNWLHNQYILFLDKDIQQYERKFLKINKSGKAKNLTPIFLFQKFENLWASKFSRKNKTQTQIENSDLLN